MKNVFVGGPKSGSRKYQGGGLKPAGKIEEHGRDATQHMAQGARYKLDHTNASPKPYRFRIVWRDEPFLELSAYIKITSEVCHQTGYAAGRMRLLKMTSPHIYPGYPFAIPLNQESEQTIIDLAKYPRVWK